MFPVLYIYVRVVIKDSATFKIEYVYICIYTSIDFNETLPNANEMQVIWLGKHINPNGNPSSTL